eukprot:jgi/Bigna1/89403/estExt_fgenesh1_pg.C_480130
MSSSQGGGGGRGNQNLTTVADDSVRLDSIDAKDLLTKCISIVISSLDALRMGWFQCMTDTGSDENDPNRSNNTPSSTRANSTPRSSLSSINNISSATKGKTCKQKRGQNPKKRTVLLDFCSPSFTETSCPARFSDSSLTAKLKKIHSKKKKVKKEKNGKSYNCPFSQLLLSSSTAKEKGKKQAKFIDFFSQEDNNTATPSMSVSNKGNNRCQSTITTFKRSSSWSRLLEVIPEETDKELQAFQLNETNLTKSNISFGKSSFGGLLFETNSGIREEEMMKRRYRCYYSYDEDLRNIRGRKKEILI